MQNFIGFQEIASLFVCAIESLTANGRLSCRSPRVVMLGIFGALTKFKSAANDLPYTSQVALGLFGQCNAQASKVAHCVSPTQLPMCCWGFVVVAVCVCVCVCECMRVHVCLFLCESKTIQMQVPTYFFHCGF